MAFAAWWRCKGRCAVVVIENWSITFFCPKTEKSDLCAHILDPCAHLFSCLFLSKKTAGVKGVNQSRESAQAQYFSPNPSVIVLGSLVKAVSDCNSTNGALCPLDRTYGHFWPPASQGVIGVNRSKNIKNHFFRPQQGHRSLVILFIFKVCYLTWYSLMVWQS